MQKKYESMKSGYDDSASNATDRVKGQSKEEGSRRQKEEESRRQKSGKEKKEKVLEKIRDKQERKTKMTDSG